MSESTLLPVITRWVPKLLGGAYAAMAAVEPAFAQPQPTLPMVNLGYSNYLDGVAGPGWRLQEITVFYQAAKVRGADGQTVASPSDVTAVASQTQVGFLARRRIWGAYWGADIQLPIARIETRLGPRRKMAETGLGDLIVSPLILQWPRRPLFGRPFSQRLSLTAILPTGDYESSRPVNLGDHAIHFNPYYAATWELTPQWDLTARLHYLWNGKNSDPPVAMGANSIQAGQAIHANFSTSYALTPDLRVGLGGYALRQLTGDKIDRVALRRSRERVIAVGPGLMWRQAGTMLAANIYTEFGARNRPEGTRISIRWAKAFGPSQARGERKPTK
jgi:hypothetical protein